MWEGGCSKVSVYFNYRYSYISIFISSAFYAWVRKKAGPVRKFYLQWNKGRFYSFEVACPGLVFYPLVGHELYDWMWVDG